MSVHPRSRRSKRDVPSSKYYSQGAILVTDPANAAGRYRARFGAKRLRAARQAGLLEVPVTVATQAHDAYAQVAEDLKRHGLTSLDLARFIRSRVVAGESNATIAKRLAVDQTTSSAASARAARSLAMLSSVQC